MKNLVEMLNNSINESLINEAKQGYRVLGVLPMKEVNKWEQDISEYKKYILNKCPLPDPADKQFVVWMEFDNEDIRPQIEEICKKYSDLYKNSRKGYGFDEIVDL